MALKLPDSAVPMGDFPVAKAVDIDFDDGENLQDKFDNGELGGGGGSSEKQIKDWVSGETYEIGDYVYYDGKLYRCLATNNNVDFDKINWEQLTYDIDELSKEDVEGLLGLTKEEIEAMTDLILDTEVKIDKTYSSSKIYQDIQQCLNDSKTFTLLELGKFSGVSYKIVASTSEMTNESIIYLLVNGNTYDMYIVEENGATTKIGDMNVNLDNYFTKAEIEADYLKKADADGKYAKKTEVLSADNVSHIKRFYSVPDNDWNNAIEEGYYAIPFDSVANTIANRPYDYAIQVHVIKADTNDPIFIYQIAYISTSDTRIYIRKQKIDGSWTPWGRICTTSIADVNKTTITPASSNITGTIKYTVKNGTCYVSFKSVRVTTNGTFSISTTMPKPDISCSIGIISDVSNYMTGCAYIDENTTQLKAAFYSTNYAGSCSFSYPVAE